LCATGRPCQRAQLLPARLPISSAFRGGVGGHSGTSVTIALTSGYPLDLLQVRGQRFASGQLFVRISRAISIVLIKQTGEAVV